MERELHRFDKLFRSGGEDGFLPTKETPEILGLRLDRIIVRPNPCVAVSPSTHCGQE